MMLAPTGKRGEREREKQPPIHTLLPLLLFSGSSPADLVPPPLQQLLLLCSTATTSKSNSMPNAEGEDSDYVEDDDDVSNDDQEPTNVDQDGEDNTNANEFDDDDF